MDIKIKERNKRGMKDKNEIINLIGAKTNDPINKVLSKNILAVLCADRKQLGVFKTMLVSDIRDRVVAMKQFDLGNTREQQDLNIRIELYKLRNKGCVDFEDYRKNRYTVKSNLKGLEYCKTLAINQLIDEGITKDQLKNVEIVEDEELWVGVTY